MSTPRTDPPTFSTAAGQSPPRTRPLNWVMLIAGVLLASLGLVLTVAGAALVAAESSQRDGRYAYTDTERFQSAGNAITTSPISLDLGDRDSIGGFDLQDVLRIQVRATPVVSGQDVFIGVAPAADVSDYLEGVPHSELREPPWGDRGAFGETGWESGWSGWDRDSGRGSDTRADSGLEDVPGNRTPAPPTEQDFWAQSATGADQQTLTVEYQTGDWVLVVMNADGSRPVWVDAQAGAHTELFGLANPGVLVAGIVGLLLGIPLILVGAAGLGRDLDRDPWAGPSVRGERGRPDPLQLTGHLDPQLSRGMWLIKWLLAIPHYIVLGLLWFAALVVTVAAGFAILFTGRYPRPWFTFTVGVMRWSWRAGFYAYSALGTDRYPPFSLARADYPAGLDVAYPERLSRGLVLVKWWLLAIPHLLIVGIFTGGTMAATNNSDGSGTSLGFSLLGLLVLIAAIALLFTGRYPPGVFDLVMGLNRWVNRVGSYMLLLRDEYPPFRLDQGPEESAWEEQTPWAESTARPSAGPLDQQRDAPQ